MKSKRKYKLVIPLAVNLFHHAGRVDRLWRKIAKMYKNRQITLEEMVKIDADWESIHSEFDRFIDNINQMYTEWEDESKKEDTPCFVVPLAKRGESNSKIIRSAREKGHLYIAECQTDMGRRTFEMSGKINVILVILSMYCSIHVKSLEFQVIVYDHITEFVDKIRMAEIKYRKQIMKLEADAKKVKKRSTKIK